MNKQERKLKGMYKFKKRLKNYRREGTNSYIYKTTGKPCSCVMCSPAKTGEERSQEIKRKDSCDINDQMVEYVNRHEDFWEDCFKYEFWDDDPFW